MDRLNAKQREKRLTWQEVLALAHSSEEVQRHSLAVKEGSDQQTWLTERGIISALKVVALRRDAPTISKDEYVSELEAMRSAGVQVEELRLPTISQITTAMARKHRQRQLAFPLRVQVPTQRKKAASPNTAKKPARKSRSAKPISISPDEAWNAALQLADLQPYKRQAGTPSLSAFELIERCYAIHGTLPTGREAIVFARANDIPYQARQKLTWTESVSQWRKDRETKGLDCPSAPPPLHERPEYARPAGAGKPGEHRPRSWANIDDCLTHVIAYLEQLSPGERATQEGYRRWAKQQRKPNGPIIPHESAFTKHGGWTRVRKLAQERMNPGATPASQPTTGADEKTGRRIPKTKVRAASKPTAAPRQAPRSARTRAKPSKNKEAPADLDPVSRLQRQSFRMPAQPRRRRKR